MARFDNPVYAALRQADYEWDDSSLVRTALRNEGVQVEATEMLAVVGVGIAAGYFGSKILNPIALGALAYVAGYYVRGQVQK